MRKISTFFLFVSTVSLIAFPACTGSRHGGPPTEKILRIPSEAKIRSLDPHVTHDAYSSMAQALFYESLYQYHFLKRPLSVVPALADGMPDISKDFKKFRFRLKKGVHFNDDACFESTGGKGPEVTADDIVYFFERVASPKIVSPAYGSFEDTVVGIKEFHEGKASSISGVKKLDPYTVEISLLKPSPRFIFNFVDTHGAIVPKECVEKLGDGFARHPVGTGPFKVTSAKLESKITAERNPNYKHMVYPSDGNPGDAEKGLLADAGKPLPLVDRLVLEVIVERQPMWLKFKSGELETTLIPKDAVVSELKDNKPSPELQKLGVQHHREVRGDVVVYFFNMDDPVWGKKKELRQAIALALDSEDIIKNQYSGQAIRAQSLIEPGQYGYDPAFKSRWSMRNIAKAKELLAKAGYPNGQGLPPAAMPSSESSDIRQFNERVQKQLAEVGIQLKVEPMTWPEFEQRLHKRNYVMAMMGYASTTPDAEDSMGVVYSKNIATQVNLTSYKNPEVDKLIDDVSMLENGPERMKKIARWRDILDEDLPYVAIAHRVGNQFFQRWVKNAHYIDTSQIGSFTKYLGVETAAEKK